MDYLLDTIKKKMLEIYKNILFLTILIVSNCYTAEPIQKSEKIIEPIIIKNFDTPISPLLGIIEVRINLKNITYEAGSLKLYSNVPAGPLINFWQQKFDPCLSLLNVRFCPLIIRYRTNGNLENLGTLDEKEHYYTKKACRRGCAIYFPYQQGAIIYHSTHKIEKDDFIYTNIMRKLLDIREMIHNNQREPLSSLK